MMIKKPFSIFLIINLFFIQFTYPFGVNKIVAGFFYAVKPKRKSILKNCFYFKTFRTFFADLIVFGTSLIQCTSCFSTLKIKTLIKRFLKYVRRLTHFLVKFRRFQRVNLLIYNIICVLIHKRIQILIMKFNHFIKDLTHYS